MSFSRGIWWSRRRLLTHDEDARACHQVRQAVITGKSPTQIAFGRLRRDLIAMTCFVIVVFFVLIAVGAPLWCDLLGISTDTVRASERIDLVTRAAADRPAQPRLRLRPTRSASPLAPATTTSPTGCTAAGPRCSWRSSPRGRHGHRRGPRPDRRLRRRRRRLGDRVLHRHLPHLPVPPGGAGDLTDHRGPLRHQHRPLREAHLLDAGLHPGDLRLDGDDPADPR